MVGTLSIWMRVVSFDGLTATVDLGVVDSTL